MDVLEHLVEEHRKVEQLLGRLQEGEAGVERDRMLAELRDALDVHMAVEERFLYPLVAEHLGEEQAADAADEHALTRAGLASVEERRAEGAFEAAIEILRQGISHHVEEEEGEIFPALRRAAGRQLARLDPAELEAAVRAEGDHGRASSSGDEPTKDELYERARAAGIEGRSAMTKDELADALGD